MDGWMGGWTEEDLINKKKKVHAVAFCFCSLPDLIADAARNRDLPILVLQIESTKAKGEREKKRNSRAREGNPTRPMHTGPFFAALGPSKEESREGLGGESRGCEGTTGSLDRPLKKKNSLGRPSGARFPCSASDSSPARYPFPAHSDRVKG